MRQVLVLLSCLIVLAASAPAADLLIADFEGLTLDAPIPLGGAAAGQPYSMVQTEAVIRNTPLTGLCLELTDSLDYGTGTVYFDFINEMEVTSGTVTIDVDLWFHMLEEYSVYVRESHGASSSFTSLRFSSDGGLYYNDAAGGNVFPIASYEIDRLHHLSLAFDQDAGTYDVLLDGVLILDDRAHGITDDGVGGVAFATRHDADLDGTFSIDNLTVRADDVTPAETVSFSEVKLRWR